MGPGTCSPPGVTRTALLAKHQELHPDSPYADAYRRMFAFYDHYEHYEIPEAGKAILRSLDVKMQIFHDLHDAQKWLLAN